MVRSEVICIGKYMFFYLMNISMLKEVIIE